MVTDSAIGHAAGTARKVTTNPNHCHQQDPFGLLTTAEAHHHWFHHQYHSRTKNCYQMTDQMAQMLMLMSTMECHPKDQNMVVPSQEDHQDNMLY